MRAQTPLEVIAEKLEQKKSEELEDILMRSGSTASKKNEYGITVIDDNNAASSLVFKSINRPKLDKGEIEKAIDIEISELKPNIPTKRKDLVPKPLYDEQVALVADLTEQVNDLNSQIDELNNQISSLEAQVETEINNRLTIEQTNDALANQIASLTTTIEDFSNQIQSAVQKSVEESILRASLQAQNSGYKVQVEALIKQIDSLNSIIEGLQAQLGAVQQQQAIEQDTQGLAAGSGGDVVNKIAIVDFNPTNGPKCPKIQAKFKNARDNAFEWMNGNSVKVTNNDKHPIQVTISSYYPEGSFFTIPKTDFTLPPDGDETINLALVRNFRYGGRDNTRSVEGKFTVAVKRYDNSVESKDFRIRLWILHPKGWKKGKDEDC